MMSYIVIGVLSVYYVNVFTFLLNPLNDSISVNHRPGWTKGSCRIQQVIIAEKSVSRKYVLTSKASPQCELVNCMHNYVQHIR